jgi:hypothetical protein
VALVLFSKVKLIVFDLFLVIQNDGEVIDFLEQVIYDHVEILAMIFHY